MAMKGGIAERRAIFSVIRLPGLLPLENGEQPVAPGIGLGLATGLVHYPAWTPNRLDAPQDVGLLEHMALGRQALQGRLIGVGFMKDDVGRAVMVNAPSRDRQFQG